MAPPIWPRLWERPMPRGPRRPRDPGWCYGASCVGDGASALPRVLHFHVSKVLTPTANTRTRLLASSRGEGSAPSLCRRMGTSRRGDEGVQMAILESELPQGSKGVNVGPGERVLSLIAGAA